MATCNAQLLLWELFTEYQYGCDYLQPVASYLRTNHSRADIQYSSTLDPLNYGRNYNHITVNCSVMCFYLSFFKNVWFRRRSLILINGRELWVAFYFHLQWFYQILHLNKLLHKKTIWDLLWLPWSASLHSGEYDPFTELLITSMLSFWSLNDPIMPGSICK